MDKGDPVYGVRDAPDGGAAKEELDKCGDHAGDVEGGSGNLRGCKRGGLGRRARGLEVGG